MIKLNSVHVASSELLEEANHLKYLYTALSGRCTLPTKSNKWKQLSKDALRHSVEIELSGLKGAEKTREKRRSSKDLKRAYEWGSIHYEDNLSEDYILSLAREIDPVVNARGYRNSGVRLRTQNGFHLPPSSEKIDREMDYFLFEHSCIDDPLEKAVHAHFHLARIHPFGDGNGRLARLVQNICLEKNGYFPISIDSSEREEYLDLISEAICSYNYTTARILDSSKYQELNSFLSAQSLKLRELHYAKALALQLVASKVTPEKNQFYSYLLQKQVKELREESDKIIKHLNCRNGGKKLKR